MSLSRCPVKTRIVAGRALDREPIAIKRPLRGLAARKEKEGVMSHKIELSVGEGME